MDAVIYIAHAIAVCAHISASVQRVAQSLQLFFCHANTVITHFQQDASILFQYIYKHLAFMAGRPDSVIQRIFRKRLQQQLGDPAIRYAFLHVDCIIETLAVPDLLNGKVALYMLYLVFHRNEFTAPAEADPEKVCQRRHHFACLIILLRPD